MLTKIDENTNCQSCMFCFDGLCRYNPPAARGDYGVDVPGDYLCGRYVERIDNKRAKLDISSDVVKGIIRLCGEKSWSIRTLAGLAMSNGLVSSISEGERWIHFLESEDLIQTYEKWSGSKMVMQYYNDDLYTPPQKKGKKK